MISSENTFINLSFFPIRKDLVDFIKARHKVDRRIYNRLEREWNVIQVGHLARGVQMRGGKKEKFFPSFSTFFAIPRKSMRYIQTKKPSVVLVHSFAFPLQTLVLKWMLPRDTTFIFQHHAEKPFRNPLKRLLQKRACRGGQAFFFAAKELAEQFVKARIIKDRGKIVEMMEVSTVIAPQPKHLAREALGLGEKTILLWVGRLNTNKDPMTVLRAMKVIKEQGRPLALYMVFGLEEMLEQVQSFIREVSLEDHVRLIGPVKHEVMEKWYSAADYYISASHYEGSGVALCEAMACGCVPVVTDIPSFRTMTRDGACAYLYRAGDHQQLAHILSKLDRAEDLKRGTLAIEIFQEDLSYEAIATKLYDTVSAIKKI